MQGFALLQWLVWVLTLSLAGSSQMKQTSSFDVKQVAEHSGGFQWVASTLQQGQWSASKLGTASLCLLELLLALFPLPGLPFSSPGKDTLQDPDWKAFPKTQGV